MTTTPIPTLYALLEALRQAYKAAQTAGDEEAVEVLGALGKAVRERMEEA